MMKLPIATEKHHDTELQNHGKYTRFICLSGSAIPGPFTNRPYDNNLPLLPNVTWYRGAFDKRVIQWKNLYNVTLDRLM
jgi:hypothetical protein